MSFQPDAVPVCPPTPGRKHMLVCNNDTPNFFPRNCSIFGEMQSTTNKEVDNCPELCMSQNAPSGITFTLERRSIFEDNVSTIDYSTCIDMLPDLPFVFPTNKAKPCSSVLHRTTSNPNKLPSYQRRGSLVLTSENKRRSFAAQCA